MTTPIHAKMQNQISAAAELLNIDQGLTFRAMFGGAMAYVDGRVFASLSNIGLGLKLSPKDQSELLNLPGAVRLQYEPGQPPSKSYIVVPESVQTDAVALAGWLKKSVAYVADLPVKKPRI